MNRIEGDAHHGFNDWVSFTCDKSVQDGIDEVPEIDSM